MIDQTSKKDKNSFYHLIYEKNIDWAIILCAFLVVLLNIVSKNWYFFASKLFLVFCMFELLRKYFVTRNQIGIYYKTSEKLDEKNEELDELDLLDKNKDAVYESDELTTELNILLQKANEKNYNSINDYYANEIADFVYLGNLLKNNPQAVTTSIEIFLTIITSVMDLRDIPSQEKKNYKRISGILLLVLLFFIIYFFEVSTY